MGLEELSRAADVLSRARLVAVASGAGISKESGIPTFREAQTGLWARYDPQQLATPHAFRRNPDLVWSWYMYRRDLVGGAKPNPGHHAVAELEELVPQVVVLTQNIDGYHAQAGSSDIVELHGNIRRYRCFADCRGSPTLIDLDTIDYDGERAPTCPHCGDYIRPDVVWFTETLPPAALQRAFEVAAACDVMLVVGTSGIVKPAASLPAQAKHAGAMVIEINAQPSLITPVADIFLEGPSGEVLPRLVNAVRAQQER